MEVLLSEPWLSRRSFDIFVGVVCLAVATAAMVRSADQMLV